MKKPFHTAGARKIKKKTRRYVNIVLKLHLNKEHTIMNISINNDH